MDFEHSTSQAADRPPGEVTQASGTRNFECRTQGNLGRDARMEPSRAPPLASPP
jgi:hypothetical protein